MKAWVRSRGPNLLPPCHPGAPEPVEENPGSSVLLIIMTKTYYIYMLASGINGTLYIGVTSNLKKRMQEHKDGTHGGFTKKYRVHILVYFEQTSDVYVALEREKKLKRFKRKWKLELIEENNPYWRGLYFEL